MNKRKIDEALSLLGYTDSKIRDALLDVFYILDSRSFDDDDKERILTIGAELVTQKETSELPDNPIWTDFKQGETKPGDVVRIKSEGYVGKAAWHLGKVGRINAIRSGRVVVSYIGRSDGVGHYHHPNMIEVLKND